MSENAVALINALSTRGLMLVCAESCTGGLIASRITTIAGASKVFERGFITYSNAAKTEMLGVPEALITQHGAVSAEVAASMAEGALKASHAHISIAATGIAGPGGGSAHKPVGLVYLAVSLRGGKTRVEEKRYDALNRQSIQHHSAEDALQLALQLLAEP